MDLIGDGGHEGVEEGPGFSRGALDALDEGVFGGPVDGDEEIDLTLSVRTSAMSMWK